MNSVSRGSPVVFPVLFPSRSSSSLLRSLFLCPPLILFFNTFLLPTHKEAMTERKSYVYMHRWKVGHLFLFLSNSYRITLTDSYLALFFLPRTLIFSPPPFLQLLSSLFLCCVPPAPYFHAYTHYVTLHPFSFFPLGLSTSVVTPALKNAPLA
jgi:hypothetical protein